MRNNSGSFNKADKRITFKTLKLNLENPIILNAGSAKQTQVILPGITRIRGLHTSLEIYEAIDTINRELKVRYIQR